MPGHDRLVFACLTSEVDLLTRHSDDLPGALTEADVRSDLQHRPPATPHAHHPSPLPGPPRPFTLPVPVPVLTKDPLVKRRRQVGRQLSVPQGVEDSGQDFDRVAHRFGALDQRPAV
ncbi:hypothetical protein [Streptomyces sp. CB01201]|uniref:hypothetical protein n=1 Tax=Streptomyces sp. CB01201 TaxID=2020324 RepID=UPI001F3708D5|nr:hypothetical protein [Streptomyces sp. CB01201]